MRIVLLPLLVILLTSVQPAAQPAQDAGAPAPPCKCADVAAMKERLQQAKAAIQELQKQIGVIKAQEAREQRTLEFTAQRYLKLNGHVEAAMAAALSAGATNPVIGYVNDEGQRVGSDTNTACEIKLGNSSDCINAGLLRHESVHQRECQKNKSKLGVLGNLVTGSIDWKDKKTLVEFALEEIEAYGAEVTFLEQSLPSVERTCRQPRRVYTSRIPRPGVRNAPPRWNNI